MGGLLVIIFFVFVGVVANQKSCSGPTSIPHPSLPPIPSLSDPATSAEPVLELQSWNWIVESGFATGEGTVKNISSQKLENVEVLVMFQDRNGDLITTGEALIEYNPILPGQISPFRAMATANPAMEKASIDFKRLMGGTLCWKSVPRKGK
jgi:hypothetical protein